MDRTSMEQLLKNLDRQTRRIERILPTLATKREFRAANRRLATKKELRAAIKPLATRAELRAAIEPLATKVEMLEEGQRTRRHFDVVAESLRDDIRLIAESQVGLLQRLDEMRAELKADIAGLDRRLIRLETAH